MKFEERKTGPIYYYDNEENFPYAYRYYLLFQKKKLEKIKEIDEDYTFEQALDKMQTLAYCTLGEQLITTLDTLNRNIVGKTRATHELIYCLSNCLPLATSHRDFVLKSWAQGAIMKSKRSKPMATLRIKGLLPFLGYSKKPTDQFIIEAAKKIASKYKQHTQEREQILDEEIRECHGRQAVGFNAAVIYRVYPEIQKFINGELKLPEEHAPFTQFNFPAQDFQEKKCKIRTDSSLFEIVIDSDGDAKRNFRISDVSSIILNEKPQESLDSAYWLRINGRKIPKSQSLCKSI